MKKFDIKGMPAINQKASNTILTKEQLHNTGRAFGGIRFWIGDILVFPDWDELETFQDCFIGTDGKEHFFPVVKVGLNTQVRNIPMGSFRRHATGLEESVEAYAKIDDLHRSITLAQDDFELLQLFAGKTVKVKQLFDARCIKWDENKKRVPYNSGDVHTFTTARWPVFEIVEE